MEKRDTLVIENARIIFRNFAGAEGKYNPKGHRNFCVILDDMDTVNALMADGWNIKELPPREEGDDPAYFTRIKVRFDNFPPKIYMVTGHNKTLLDEDTVCMLDHADIENVDMVINPSYYDTGDKSGVVGYLKTMYVTVREDEFEAKYRFDENEAVPF